MKTTFKVNQKVFDYSYGWGRVSEMYEDNSFSVYYIKLDVYVLYRNDGSYLFRDKTASKPVLATEEYTLNGFTQEEKVKYEDYIGRWGKFWNYDSGNDILISTLYFYNTENDYKFITNNDEAYEYFEPLTEEEIKILKLENYERDSSTYNREKGE